MNRFAGVDTYFEHFQVYPGAFADKGGDRVDSGGKCLLPSSVLGDLATKNVVYPLQFCVQTFRGKRSFCGVLEFTAPEGQAIIPQWMMAQLQAEPGATVRLTAVSLPRGGLVKFRPQQKAFIELANPKAVLEYALNNYTCLMKGQTIVINHVGEEFLIDVMETKNEEMRDVEAIFIVDTNLKVEFERPLDMPDSPVRSAPPAALPTASNVIGGQAGVAFTPIAYKPPSLTGADKEKKSAAETAQTDAKPAFMPFAGGGRTLSGRPSGAGAVTGGGGGASFGGGGGGGGASSSGRVGGASASSPPPAAVGPTQSTPAASATTAQQQQQQAPTFAPFAGKGRSLKG